MQIKQEIQALLGDHHSKNLHREFINILKNIQKPSISIINGKEIINFCSNDYLRLSCNENVIKATIDGILQYGVGSGGTRNISGTTQAHVALELQIAKLHNRERGLVFSSAYNANVGALSTLGKHIPNVAFFSDAENHASIIHGINLSKGRKFIYEHNNMQHLQELLHTHNNFLPIIVCESVYSMSGTETNLVEISRIAKQFNALTYVDEVHAVGIYGCQKNPIGGISAKQNVEIDIINGTFAKAFGCVGGYIASTHEICEFIKSFASSFIFSTSLPPAICLACLQSIKEAQSPHLQQAFWGNVAFLKETLHTQNIDFYQKSTHIVSVPVKTVERVKTVAKKLLQNYHCYVQPIFHPTVPVEGEILRITVSPHHTKEEIQHLAQSIRLCLDSI